MRRTALAAVAITIVTGVAAYMESASGQSNGDAAPIYGIKIPDGYRDWRLISVKRLTGKQLTGAGGELKQLRAELGNDLAIKAYRDGTLPFPDGAIIAALHWNENSSDADNQALAVGFPGLGLQSSFAGSAVNAQFMVKDSKKYAASGGWGFADFTNGHPGNEALHAKCFPCHPPGKRSRLRFHSLRAYALELKSHAPNSWRDRFWMPQGGAAAERGSDTYRLVRRAPAAKWLRKAGRRACGRSNP